MKMTQDMAETRLHHVGFVVDSIAASIGGFMRSLGVTQRSEIIEDPIQRVRVAFLIPDQAGSPQFELVEPCGDKSPVLGFLRKGGGLHHVCYEVPDIETQLERAQREGAVIIRRPRPGVALGNRQIAWVITADKLLIEYLAR